MELLTFEGKTFFFHIALLEFAVQTTLQELCSCMCSSSHCFIISSPLLFLVFYTSYCCSMLSFKSNIIMCVSCKSNYTFYYALKFLFDRYKVSAVISPALIGAAFSLFWQTVIWTCEMTFSTFAVILKPRSSA